MGNLTDYSQATRDIVDKAVETLVRLPEKDFGADADPPDVYVSR